MTPPELTIFRRRQAASIAWFVVAACVLLSALAKLPLFGLATWLGTLALLLVTGRIHHAMPEEKLARPRAYHVIAGAVLGVSIAGCVMGMLPDASERSQLLAVFFGITAILAYRALVASGPRPVMWLCGITSFTWLPAAVVLVIRCKCGRHESNWTEVATTGLFQGLLVLVGVLLAITLQAFERRTTQLPDATLR